jgi:hypothetical protein
VRRAIILLVLAIPQIAIAQPSANNCAACVGAADCGDKQESCVAGCRARFFVIDPYRDGCIADCSARALQCGRIATNACMVQHLCR